jgi:putative hydrolase of the HAD superfamily
MKLRAVLFDYGMVLSAPACPIAHRNLVQLFGASVDIFDRFYWANRHDYDAGLFDGESYWRKVASDAETTLTPERIRKLIEIDIRMWSRINAPMVEWARSVGHAGFQTGILSNMCFELIVALERTFLWLGEFRYSTWSCRVRLAKPDPGIFQLALDKLQVRAEETLFIDDRPENIRAAEAAGISGIVFEDVPRLHADLEGLGLAPLLPKIVFRSGVPEFREADG